MKKTFSVLRRQIAPVLALSASLVVAGQANASLIQVSTGYSTAGSQTSAAAYQSVVQAAVATPTAGYGSTTLSSFNNVSNNSLFGANSNIAFDYTIDFGVTAAQAGTWEFRAGVDFGHGGAVFLDGVALGFKTNDMWWNSSFGNTSGTFDYTAPLTAGNHVLSIFGLENCCDGTEQGQFRAANSTSFVTFSATDTLNAAVIPEPSSIALLGLGMFGFAATSRRKKQ